MNSRILFLILCVAFAAGAQTHWSVQASGVTKDLHAVSCPVPGTCYASGDSGIVVKTTNGGTSWTHQYLAGATRLEALDCPSVNVCYASGPRDSMLYRTTNGGGAWIALYDRAVATISCMSDSTCMSAIHQYSRRYNDWGLSHTGINRFPDYLGGDSNRIQQVQAIAGATYISAIHVAPVTGLPDTDRGGPKQAFAALIRSYDSTTGFHPATTLRDVAVPGRPELSHHFWSVDSGCVAGSWGELTCTSNGGAGFTTVSIPAGLRAVHFPDGAHGYAAGDSGRILETSDRGATSTLVRPVTVALRALDATDPLTVYAVGDGGAIVKRTANPVSLQASPGGSRPRARPLKSMRLVLPDGRLFDLRGRAER